MLSTDDASVTNVLDLRDVTKRYEAQHGGTGQALDRVSLSVSRSEFVALVGPSGCGKTTLLKIAAGLLPMTDGVSHFLGRPGSPPPRDIGVVFQTPVLLPWRTVLDNVLLPAQVQREKGDPRKRAHELLELLEITGTSKMYPGELSGGMQQRVAIARSLLLSPRILFMDEPFGALDAMTRETMNVELQRIHLGEGTTVLFVTHDITEAVFLADRIAVMSARPGRIVDIIDVPLARPRTPADLTGERFRRIEADVRSALSGTAKAA